MLYISDNCTYVTDSKTGMKYWYTCYELRYISLTTLTFSQ